MPIPPPAPTPNQVPELHTLYQLFTAKYGKVYSEEVINSKEKYLSHRLLRMLTSTQVPDPSVVELYLTGHPVT